MKNVLQYKCFNNLKEVSKKMMVMESKIMRVRVANLYQD